MVSSIQPSIFYVLIVAEILDFKTLVFYCLLITAYSNVSVYHMSNYKMFIDI